MLAWLRDLNSHERRTTRRVRRGTLGAAIALLATAGAAYADDARTVPAPGIMLTYRLVSTTKTPTKTISTGQIYTYIVAKSDGTTAEGVIKPNAIILMCDGGASDLACKDAAASPGAHLDGNLLTVPVDSDSGDALSKHSAFKLNHFLVLSRVYPFPSSRDPQEYNLHDFGPDPAFTFTNTLNCDDLAKLDAFLPFGKAPQVTLSCETIFERSASRDGKLPPLSMHESAAMEIAYTGSGWVTVPSGSWQVQKYTTTMTPKEAGHQSSEAETVFSTQLGVAVRSHLVGHNPASQTTTENTVELISVSQ
jgi:hypothetical protein